MLMLLLAAFIIIPIIWGILEMFDKPTPWEKKEKEDKKLAKYERKLRNLQIHNSPEMTKRRNTAKKIAKWWFIIIGIVVVIMFIEKS